MHLVPISKSRFVFGKRLAKYRDYHTNKIIVRVEKQCPICKVDIISSGFHCCGKCYEYAYYHQNELNDDPEKAIAVVGSLLDPVPTGKQVAQALIDKCNRILGISKF